MFLRDPLPINAHYATPEPGAFPNGNLPAWTAGMPQTAIAGGTSVNGARPYPQAYKDISGDRRTGLSSFFAYGKRMNERDAYQAAHMTPSGVPGILNLKVCDSEGRGMAFAPFNWNGRQMLTDAHGMIKYVDKDYFQTAISLENERVKYVTQMISLVAGQPADNVIALFGLEFYSALAGCANDTDEQAVAAQKLYWSYLNTAGIDPQVAARKMYVFKRYSNAEASPEVMCNFGDNDPEWSRAFNKLALLVEFHPSAMLFDGGSLNPLESSGSVHGDTGAQNVAGLSDRVKEQKAVAIMQNSRDPNRFRRPAPGPPAVAAPQAPIEMEP